jgi:hypothetical protein
MAGATCHTAMACDCHQGRYRMTVLWGGPERGLGCCMLGVQLRGDPLAVSNLLTWPPNRRYELHRAETDERGLASLGLMPACPALPLPAAC